MAFYSTGGTTFPDFGVFLFVMVCGLISVVLNPPVLYRHLGAPFTVHRVTSFLIALLNLVSSIIQVYAAFAFILPTCDEDIQNLGNRTVIYPISLSCGEIVQVTTGIVVYSLTLTNVILLPNLFTAIMLIARYFQLTHPLRTPPKRLYLGIAVAVSVFQGTSTVRKSLANSQFVIWMQPLLLAANMNPFKFRSLNIPKQLVSLLLDLFLPFIFQVVGVVFVGLTIAHLRNTRGMAARQSGRDPNKITLRILLLNAGSIVHTVLLIIFVCYTLNIATTARGTISLPYKISSTGFFVVLPILLSALNPLVYFGTACTTPKKNNTVRSHAATDQSRS